MCNPQFSIIVPIYNVEAFLRKCLDHIKNQTFTDWEAILIDDGSADDSGKICDEYSKSDSRFTVYHTANQGVSKARNLGIDKAQGSFVLFVDADDWLELKCLEVCEKEMTQNRIDILQFASNRICKNQCNPSRTYNSTVCNGYEYLSKNLFNTSVWASSIRRDILLASEIRFYSELRYGQDLIFTILILSKCNRIKHIDKILYNYRTDNETSKIHNISNKDLVNLCEQYIILAKNLPFMKNWIDQHIIWHLFDLIQRGMIDEKIIANIYKRATLRNHFEWPYNLYSIIAHINHHLAYIVIRIGLKIKRLS